MNIQATEKQTSGGLALRQTCRAAGSGSLLARLGELHREQTWLTQKLELLRAASTDTSAKITCAPGGGPCDRLGILMEQIDETERQLKENEAERQAQIRMVMTLIEQLADSRVRRVMCEKFILRRTLMEISRSMNYSCSYITRLYRRGIRQIEEAEGHGCSTAARQTESA